MDNILGELLERLRGKMSLREASEKSGLSHTYIRDLENGLNRTTKAPIKPSVDALKRLAEAYHYPYEKLAVLAADGTTEKKKGTELIQFYLDQMRTEDSNNPQTMKMVPIPILGTIKAGYDLYAEQNIEGYELMAKEHVSDGEYFYLKVKGDSMIGDRIQEGDRVLVRRQDFVEDGKIAVVLVNGDEATLKKVTYAENEMVILHASNPNIPPRVLPASEVLIQGQVTKVEFDA